MLSKQEAEKMARENILPFWQGMTDNDKGGFYGEADFYGVPDKNADKGCILNSRILWTFSAAYRLFKDNSYRACAAQAKDFLHSAFLDKKYGGLYWLVDSSGKALNTRKQFYNIAFAVYALSEHYLAFGDSSSLKLALELFRAMEEHGLDPKDGGYIEACERDWRGIKDFRLSDKDLNSPKSMNTNLHVLEAYTVLVNALENVNASSDIQPVTRADTHTNAAPDARAALYNLLRVTLDKIVNRNNNFELFFDMNWKSICADVSWGHDIEGSWLMYKAALVLGQKELIDEVKQTALKISESVLNNAFDHKNGGLLSGKSEKGIVHAKKEWWPQAEAVIGFYNAYELSGEQKYFDAADAVWTYILKHFADNAHGEWHNELNPDNSPDIKMPKAGFWKCPYHNARACFEIITRRSN